MTAKAELISTLEYIGESEASQILRFVKETFILKPKAWADIEDDDPEPDEIAAFRAYRGELQEAVAR
jgi:hypothetical protein